MEKALRAVFKKAKSVIRAYLANPAFFPEEFLARLLDDARAGRVLFLNTDGPNGCLVSHSTARSFVTAVDVSAHSKASHSYNLIGVYGAVSFGKPECWDAYRNRVLVSMALAEIRRRHRAALWQSSPFDFRSGSLRDPKRGSSTRRIMEIEAVEGRPESVWSKREVTRGC